jgi:hypothetical protein
MNTEIIAAVVGGAVTIITLLTTSIISIIVALRGQQAQSAATDLSSAQNVVLSEQNAIIHETLSQITPSNTRTLPPIPTTKEDIIGGHNVS